MQQNEDRTPDRVYNSDDFAAMFSGFWGDGIISNVSTALLVEPIENSFAVVVNPGDAFIKGRFYQNTEDKQITLSNDNAEERVDCIALRFDSEKRSVYLKYLEGAEGQGSPLCARSGSLFDLLLAKITVPAKQVTTYTVTYDANGGTGAPSPQTKQKGVLLTLSSQEPTRAGYVFEGWSLTKNSVVQYKPGGIFSVDANSTLYAIWTYDRSNAPQVTPLRAYHVANSTSTTPSANGAYNSGRRGVWQVSLEGAWNSSLLCRGQFPVVHRDCRRLYRMRGRFGPHR